LIERKHFHSGGKSKHSIIEGGTGKKRRKEKKKILLSVAGRQEKTAWAPIYADGIHGKRGKVLGEGKVPEGDKE